MVKLKHYLKKINRWFSTVYLSNKWCHRESNQGHTDFQTNALVALELIFNTLNHNKIHL
jgi:hypothetical protein